MDYGDSIPGVDLSHWDDATGDRPIDYNRLVSTVKFAICRVGDGGATDRSFVRHVNEIGGRIPIGTYLFCRPGRDARRQAEQWAEAVAHMNEGWGVKFPLGHFADLESSDGRTRVEVTEWVSDFLAVADAAFSQKVGIYTGASWWRNSIMPGYNPGDRLWWIARYPFSGYPADDPNDWPKWVEDRMRFNRHPEAPFGTTHIWQFSSQGSGAAVGTYRSHALDCNLMDYEVFERLTMPPVVLPPPVPVNNPEVILPDTLEFVKRANEDPRVYLVMGGKYKLWMESMDMLQRNAERLGIPAVIVEDTDLVNFCITVGEEP